MYIIIKYKENFRLPLKRFSIIISLLFFSLITIAQNNNNEKILFVGSNGLPPYEYTNVFSRPDGFVVDITRAIAKELNLNYDISLKTFSESYYDALTATQPTVIMSLEYSNSRDIDFEFSQPHCYVYNYLVCKKEANIHYWQDLRDKSIVIINGAITYDILKEFDMEKNCHFVDDMIDGLYRVSNGEFDVAICSHELALFTFNQMDVNNLEIINMNIKPQNLCYATKDNNKELIALLNKGLDIIKNNGTYDKIYNQWFGVHTDVFTMSTTGYIVFVVVLIILLIISIAAYVLKKQVKNATRKLGLANIEIGKQLKENKALSVRLSMALDASNLSVWRYDNKTKLFSTLHGELKLNQKWESIKKLIADDNIDFIEDKWKRLFNTNIKKDSVVIKFKTGNTREFKYVKNYYNVKRDANGKLLSVIGTYQDITDEYLSTKLLSESKIKADISIKGGNINPWEYDCDTKLLYGIAGDHIISDDGMTLDVFLSCIHEDDKDKTNSALDILREERNESFSIDIRYKAIETEDWHYGTFAAVPFEFNNFGKCTKYTGYRKDTTEWYNLTEKLSQINEQNRLILDNAQSAILYFTPDYKIKWENVSKIYPFMTPDIQLNSDIICFKDIHHRKDVCDNCIVATALHSGKIETKEINVNGRTIDVTATPVYDEKHVVKGCVAKLVDITNKKNVMIELENARKKAEQSDRLKSAFLANMSHEIRTPLNAIIGFSDLLIETTDPQERKEYGQIITTNNNLLLNLINDILDLSKIESGNIEFVTTTFDLSALFNELYATFALRVSQDVVTLKLVNPYKNFIVSLDKKRLLQIMNNFLSNAVKYTQKGEIEMGYEYVNNGLKVYVKDTGIGISDENKSRVFQRFQKFDDFVQGTGLGLSICKAIVEKVGGKIDYTSVYGKGSTFWAWLPCTINDKN